MSRTKANPDAAGLEKDKVFSLRFIIALALMVLGIAWIVVQYTVVRVDPTDFGGEPGGPSLVADLNRWNYLIGFGLLMVGLVVAAHPATPLGRGRGIVIGMLGCFLIGMLWICIFYIFNGTHLENLWVINDLGNYNILVGIAFMAVGFSYATKWE